MKKLANMLKSKRENLGLTQEELAKRVGVRPVYISQLERGIRETPSDEVTRKLAKELKINEFALFKAVYQQRLPLELQDLFVEGSRDIYTKPAREIPVINSVACGKMMETGDLDYPAGHAESFEAATTMDPNAFYVIARGDSMTGADIREGDYLLVEPNREVKHGNIVLAKTKDGTTVKQFFQYKTHIELRPMNLSHESIRIENDESLTVYRISGKFSKL